MVFGSFAKDEETEMAQTVFVTRHTPRHKFSDVRTQITEKSAKRHHQLSIKTGSSLKK
jgi:hypothetical protein